MKKILVSISAIALLMSGCAMYKKESFGNDKKYAIVSISGSNAITGIYGSHSQVNKAYLSNAQKIFDQEFLKATSFIYVPSKVVLNSKYYKSFPKKKASAGPINLNLAPGYNFISGFSRPKEFAKGSDYDGIFFIQADPFSDGAGKVYAGTALSVNAVDKSGSLVFAKVIKVRSDNQTNASGGIDMNKFYPLMLESLRNAAKTTVKMLDESYQK